MDSSRPLDISGDEMNMAEKNMEDPEVEVGVLLSTDEAAQRKKAPETSLLIYGIEDRPSWPFILLMGLQHFSANFTSCLVYPILLSQSLCFDLLDGMITRHIATTFFISGICTILQTTIGTRLPIHQGPSSGYIVPALSILNARGGCPAPLTANSTEADIMLLREEASSRMLQLQGDLLIASCIHAIIGYTGLIGFLHRYIGPLTIAVVLTMISFGIIPIIMNLAARHWAISLPTMVLVIAFSMFLSSWEIPLPRGRKFQLFAFFPMLLAMVIMWVVCAVLTFSGLLTEDSNEYGYAARVDLKVETIRSTPWLSVPYPGQWGWSFTVSAAGIVGFMTAILAGILDSVGDYHACSQVCELPMLPAHAVNRGIGAEGVCCIIAALFGAGYGYTSYSADIALLSLTKVASRIVLQASGVIFILVGLFTKLSAIFSAIPSPVLGASGLTVGMIAALGLANLSLVQMKSPRNLLILGASLFMGVGLPDYLSKNTIDTGSEGLDKLLSVLLTNGMFVGLIVCVFLDNLVPGTAEEKGRHSNNFSKQKKNFTEEELRKMKAFDFPIGMDWVRRSNFMKKMPFSPTFSK